jgi:polyisoprenoid-binding protein YceI
MKVKLLLALVLFTVKDLHAQLKPADDKSTVGFTVRNFGVQVGGTLKGLEGTIHFDPAHPADANFDISIDAATVNTDNSMRDDHLKGESYLDIKHYPKIRLTSTKVLPSNKTGVWLLTGKLTIKNHTKDISFPFSATAATGGYVFKGDFKIKRREFEVGGFSTISDEMEVNLNVLAN